MKNWLARKKHVTELIAELADMRDRLTMRSTLIHDQDDEITRLRAALKEAEKQCEFWQRKAANP